MGTSDSASTRTWEQGASGERIVGARLDKIEGIEVLHDRRIPGTRAIIDHIAIGPRGVYVIDAKLSGGVVEHGRHDQAKLVAKMRVAVTTIERALSETPIPVTAALCFVDTRWQLPARPFVLNGVWVGWADVLPDLVVRPGLLDAQAMQTTVRLLDTRLPRA